MINRRNRKQGFTLIELSLSIVFIATLSVAVTLVITNSIAAYHRGITLNQINTTGMDLVDDIETAIQGSPALSVKRSCASVYPNSDAERQKCENDGGKNLVVVKRYAEVVVGGNSIGEKIPVFGAFCSGNYSYIWNSGYFFSGEDSEVKSSNVEISKASLTYTGKNDDVKVIENFKLLKVEDSARNVCISAIQLDDGERYDYSTGGGIKNNINITGHKTNEDPVEIIGKNSNLALYDLDSAVPAENDANNSLFYSMSFILGTLRGGVNVKTTGEFCATPSSYSSVEDFDYCSVNKFNFAARTLGG